VAPCFGEILVVVQVVAGSSPVAHPSEKPCKFAICDFAPLVPRDLQDANEV
jgi:hypothetical protein